MKLIVRNRVCPEGLFIATDQTAATGVDIREDKLSQVVLIDTLSKLYRLDLTKVTIQGSTDCSPQGCGLKVALFDNHGDVFTHFEMDTCAEGSLEVRPKDGFTIEEAIERDLIGGFAKTWLKAMGKPDDWPCGIEVCLNRFGGVAIDITPCC